VPGIVRELHVIERGCNHISLSWLPPAAPNGIILGYIVHYKPGVHLTWLLRSQLTEMWYPELPQWHPAHIGYPIRPELFLAIICVAFSSMKTVVPANILALSAVL